MSPMTAVAWIVFGSFLVLAAFACGLAVADYVNGNAHKPPKFSYVQRHRIRARAADKLYAEIKQELDT